MSNPFDKFKKQLNQKNNYEEIVGIEPELDENSPLTDAIIDENELSEMKLDPKDKSFQYVFFPKNDINTYDLARILAMTQLMITPDVYEKFPDDLKRHFTTFTDLKEQPEV